MKKIINNKRYNTDTATEIASFHNGLSYTDFHHLEETLYQTPNGNWFLVGGGGPMSKYADRSGNMTTGQSNVFTVLSTDEAYDWLERHGETEALEQYFSDNIENA